MHSLWLQSGLTQQHLSDLEHGMRNPTLVTIYELSLVLKLSHTELIAPRDGIAGRSKHDAKRPFPPLCQQPVRLKDRDHPRQADCLACQDA